MREFVQTRYRHWTDRRTDGRTESRSACWRAIKMEIPHVVYCSHKIRHGSMAVLPANILCNYLLWNSEVT